MFLPELCLAEVKYIYIYMVTHFNWENPMMIMYVEFLVTMALLAYRGDDLQIWRAYGLKLSRQRSV